MKRHAIRQAGRLSTGVGLLLVPLLFGLTTATAAAGQYGNCEVTGKKGSVKLETVGPGALSVRPVLPAPGWWNGDSPETINGGFEYCMAANMAYRAGLDKVNIVSRSFAQILTGQSKGFDIALSEITITDERKKVVNFTEPYFDSDQGVLVRKGAGITAENIKNKRLGVKQGTTMVQFVMDKIKPTEAPKVYPEVAAMYAALAAGQVDAVLYDTPNVLARAKQSEGRFEVVGRYDTGERWGGLVNRDSPNLPVFNKLIQEMKADGTFDRLAAKYLAPSLGADPTKVPIFKP
jgi:polar amino acid transport system substrate-binding protein